ncbi:EamA family transporter [Labedaea rhizosphaerae]|uniref:EamA-like transporter family protein n=1 Tax=Labedaea rhizosphaerae TaxID=598644 RepID=A0A4R6S9N5_LABRH|nr:EamA family transporter [Labedaea rhizosphaerae]TDP96173.1 EamA-like transporter family protein [Labedaea rhizosphaerae]
MSPSVVAVVLAAALMHATWNAIAHNIADRVAGFALMGISDLVVGGAIVSFAGSPGAAWPYVLISAGLHIVYALFLLLSYQLGEFSQVYPLARGIGPLIVGVVSIVALGKHLPAVQLAGVVLISAGLMGLVFVGGKPGRKQLPALGAAAVTGVMIASYTVVDALGVTHGPLLAYIGWLFLSQGPVMPLVVLAQSKGRTVARLRVHAGAGLLGGMVALGAYGLVLWAQTSGALAPVAALREASIVFGAFIGALFLGEKLGHKRAIAAAVVVAGIVALTV